MNKLITILFFILLISCSNIEQLDPIGGWNRYEIKNKGSCSDFQGWEYLSRETMDGNICIKYKQFPCFVSMVDDYEFNKEFCKFNKGDIIWVYPKVGGR